MLTGCAYYPYPNYVQQPTIYVDPAIIAPQCDRYQTDGERLSCNRGAQQRYSEEQRYRENQAYRQALGR